MKKSLALILIGATVVPASLCLPRLLRACAQPSLELIFINTLHPDLSIGPYTEGNLGVIQPTYKSIYLFVAYRNLVGRPIQPSEQQALWQGDERIIGPQSMTRPERVTMPPISVLVGGQGGFSVTGGPPPAETRNEERPAEQIFRSITIREGGGQWYSQFLNCPADAFTEAEKTRQLRIQQFGEESSVVRNWEDAQKLVFQNCEQVGTIPDDLPASAPAIARADRAYQQAAAYFYAGNFDGAVSDFRAIAADPASPWNTIAPYLVARALVRKATVIDKLEPDFATLAKAEVQVESVLADPRLAQYHAAAQRLRGFIEFRLHPGPRLVELANNLMRGASDANLAQDVIDFKLLSSKIGFYSGFPGPNPAKRTGTADIRAKSDVVDWLLTFQEGPETYAHSLEKWQKTRSLAWLVAAITKVGPGSGGVRELLEAAGAVSTRSSAYQAVTFHRLRLLLLQGRRAEAREILAHLQIRKIGPRPPNLSTPPSTVNLFLALRFALAQDPNELLENAPRLPATVTDGLTPNQLPATDWSFLARGTDPEAPRFDDDSLAVLNRFLPVAIMEQTARSPKLPKNLRQQVAVAAWSRALLLGRTEVARSLAPDVEALAPGLRASVQAYLSARTEEERKFATALLILRFPGLSPFFDTLERGIPLDKIRNSGDGWWGLAVPPNVYPPYFTGEPASAHRADQLTQWPRVAAGLGEIYPGGHFTPPAFLTPKEREAAADESRQLVEIGVAPDYLSKQAIAWATTHPADPRSPEVLALAVRSTRLGCRDQQTGQYSKAAFELLHSRYPQSSWAQETKYWFK
jgi:hypothetical protein